MRILIDIDNTIENLLVAWFDAVNKKYGTDVKPEDVRDWDVMVYFPSLTKDNVFGVLKEEGFWKTVKPIPGAAEYMKKLIEDGHEIFLCTSTDWLDIRPKYEDVICEYFPFISWKQVIVSYSKQIIKADVLVDDGIHNLEGGEYAKILFSQPHNLYYNAEENGMIRAENWKQVYSAINSVGNGKL